MEVLKFGLGVRFALWSPVLTPEMERELWQEIFSVLTLGDVKNLHLYAGAASFPKNAQEHVYLCALTNGKLRQMRRVFRKLSRDAGINIHLTAQQPFLQHNGLLRAQDMRFLGAVGRDGRLAGGEGLPEGVRIPKKHGKKRPEGKGSKVMIVTEGFRGKLSPMEAIRYFTGAARKHFMGVKVVPVPVADGGESVASAAVTAAGAVYREVQLTDAQRRKYACGYAVLGGKKAVASLASTLKKDEMGQPVAAESSAEAGQLLRRMLDEGLCEIFLGAADYSAPDCGMGLARALGVRFYGAGGEELKAYEPQRIQTVDAEYLHPAARRAKLRVMCAGPLGFADLAKSGDAVYAESFLSNARRMEALVRASFPAADRDAWYGVGGGMGLMLQALFDVSFEPAGLALLEAVEFSSLLKGVSMLVTAVERLDEHCLDPQRVLPRLLQCSQRRGVPIAVVAGYVDREQLPPALDRVAIMPAMFREDKDQTPEEVRSLVEEAANRMFEFFRTGMDSIRRYRKLGKSKLKL